MDSLTQIVLGAACGELVLGKKVGNKAMLWGAIAGTIPDLDIVFAFIYDPLTATEMHRGFMHSILFCLLFSPILGWLIWKIYSKKQEASWNEWSWLAWWALFTHPVLDCFTAFGTQIFWPLPVKITFNNIFVVDPLYTIPFLISLIIVSFFNRNNPRRTSIAKFGILLSSAYMISTLVFKGISHYKFSQSLKTKNISYQSLESKPTVFNAILWCGYVESDSAYYTGYYSLFDKDSDISFNRYKKNFDVNKELEKEDIVKRLIQLTRGWYIIEKKDNKYYFYDLRFGQIGFNEQNTDSFVAFYVLEYKSGKLALTPGPRKIDNFKLRFKQLWDRILGSE